MINLCVVQPDLAEKSGTFQFKFVDRAVFARLLRIVDSPTVSICVSCIILYRSTEWVASFVWRAIIDIVTPGPSVCLRGTALQEARRIMSFKATVGIASESACFGVYRHRKVLKLGPHY